MDTEFRPLSEWAELLAPSLPETTKKMLELDKVQRQQNPLGNRLTAQLRLAVADEMRCRTARELAQRDLALAAGVAGDDHCEALALSFARRLTTAATEITDDAFQSLVETYGVEPTVAIVHTVAYANFQNRLFLALETGSLEPMALALGAAPNADVPKWSAPPRPDWHTVWEKRFQPASIERPRWSGQPFSAIVQRRELQMTRSPRIPFPPDDIIDRLPEPARSRARRVAWTAISMGYQPQLTSPWLDAMRTFAAEAQLDAVFANSIFWVVTRTNECFY